MAYREHSGNCEERPQYLCLVGLSNLLLPRTVWNPSTPNGPGAISTIDHWPGCSPSPSRVMDEVGAEEHLPTAFPNRGLAALESFSTSLSQEQRPQKRTEEEELGTLLD